jgi:uroporphyrin-III C-methyltransferase
MLTVAGQKALTQLATRVLADKLVPAEILALIPPHIPVYIARKFPGNAEAAQNELMEMAVEAARRGDTVVRVSDIAFRV